MRWLALVAVLGSCTRTAELGLVVENDGPAMQLSLYVWGVRDDNGTLQTVDRANPSNLPLGWLAKKFWSFDAGMVQFVTVQSPMDAKVGMELTANPPLPDRDCKSDERFVDNGLVIHGVHHFDVDAGTVACDFAFSAP
jgi:hypothetical protein